MLIRYYSYFFVIKENYVCECVAFNHKMVAMVKLCGLNFAKIINTYFNDKIGICLLCMPRLNVLYMVTNLYNVSIINK